jgi:hypothetical protein
MVVSLKKSEKSEKNFIFGKKLRQFSGTTVRRHDACVSFLLCKCQHLNMPSSDALRDCSNTASQNSTMEENSQPQRKRPASSLVNHSNNDGAALGTKRSKLDANNQNNNDASAEEPQNGISETSLDFTTAMTDFSVERLLSVPLEILFRQVPSTSASSLSHKRKPLLTRAEARLLSKTTLLAAEMDTILHVSSQALSQQVWCAQFSQSIESVPWLRSVVGLLRVHSTHISSAALHHLQQEMNRILQDLSSCAAALAHYAEQNWTVSESLLDAFGDDGTLLSSGQELAQHKKFLAELQEEVSSRIQTLLNDEEILKWAHGNVPTPMTQFCQQLFGLKDTTETTNPEALQQEQPTASLEQEDNHGENETLNLDTNKRGGTVSALEKEHDPKEPLNENPLLALAQEAEEHAHQWSASTVSIHSPVKKHSPMETDESEEEEYGEMTQGTSNAVAALTVLASAGRGT